MCQIISWAKLTSCLLALASDTSEWYQPFNSNNKVNNYALEGFVPLYKIRQKVTRKQSIPLLWKPRAALMTAFNDMNDSHIVAPISLISGHALRLFYEADIVKHRGRVTAQYERQLGPGSVLSSINHPSAPDRGRRRSWSTSTHTQRCCQHHYPLKQWPPCSLTVSHWSWLNF